MQPLLQPHRLTNTRSEAPQYCPALKVQLDPSTGKGWHAQRGGESDCRWKAHDCRFAVTVTGEGCRMLWTWGRKLLLLSLQWRRISLFLCIKPNPNSWDWIEGRDQGWLIPIRILPRVNKGSGLQGVMTNLGNSSLCFGREVCLGIGWVGFFMVLFITFQLYSVFSDGIFATSCFWIVIIIFSANRTGSNWVLGQLLSHWSKRKLCKSVLPELSKWIFFPHILLILPPLWPLNADFDAVSCQKVPPSHFLRETFQVSYPITLCIFPRGIFRPKISCLSLISKQVFCLCICQGEVAKMTLGKTEAVQLCCREGARTFLNGSVPRKNHKAVFKMKFFPTSVKGPSFIFVEKNNLPEIT